MLRVEAAWCPPANSRGDVEATLAHWRVRRKLPRVPRRIAGVTLKPRGFSAWCSLAAPGVPRRIAGVTLKRMAHRGRCAYTHVCPPANSRGDVEAPFRGRHYPSSHWPCPPANSRGDVEAWSPRSRPPTTIPRVPRRIAGVTLKHRLGEVARGLRDVSPGE